jgi:hypothetical protein
MALLVATRLAASASGLLRQYSAFPAAASDQMPMAQRGPAKATDSGAESFLGLQPGLGSLPLPGRGRTRSISAENPTGEKGKGGMAIPNPTEAKPAASARAADNLGQGWKVRPFLRLWELAGASGDCTVALPEAMKVDSVRPVDLRGRPAGHPIAVQDRTINVALGAFAPTSLLIQP